jgi:HlyD family secretion protein/adhesin transport system membrane fusion protein
LAKSQSLQTEIGEIRNSIPMITGKIKSSITKIKKLKSEKRSAWLKELNKVTLKIEQLSQKKLASKDREVRKIITSPVNGIVQKLYFHTIGGIVKAGDRVAEITPVDDILIIKAKIKTNDRGNIMIDQNVSIDITAYSYTKYGLLNGKLISISPDSFTEQNGNSFYEVKVKADHYAFAPDKPILPGMVANINIKTGKKTIMRYLLKPLKDIRQNALSER